VIASPGPAARTVFHLDPRLDCARSAETGSTADAEPAADVSAQLRDFASGLATTWPPDADVPLSVLGEDDWRVTRPPEPMERARCLFCAHTFRAGEQVVTCPCRPQDAACGAAVHRDPVAGLVCWESWHPGGEVEICPITTRRPPQGRFS
jgi:hypothetical protein